MNPVNIDALMRDTRHAVRRLVRDWRFTVAAVVILGLGIGANAAIFSLINATLFRQQSFADPVAPGVRSAAAHVGAATGGGGFFRERPSPRNGCFASSSICSGP